MYRKIYHPTIGESEPLADNVLCDSCSRDVFAVSIAAKNPPSVQPGKTLFRQKSLQTDSAGRNVHSDRCKISSPENFADGSTQRTVYNPFGFVADRQGKR